MEKKIRKKKTNSSKMRRMISTLKMMVWAWETEKAANRMSPIKSNMKSSWRGSKTTKVRMNRKRRKNRKNRKTKMMKIKKTMISRCKETSMGNSRMSRQRMMKRIRTRKIRNRMKMMPWTRLMTC